MSLLLSLGTASAADEFLTASDAILCLSAESLETATMPAVTRSQTVLRAMGCMRSEAGVRIRLVQNVPQGPWQVRFYPAGISGGVTLWGWPSAFTAADGSQPSVAKRT